MKKLLYIGILIRTVACTLVVACAVSCALEDFGFQDGPELPQNVEYMTFTMQSSNLLPQKVTTKAYDPKSEAERAINHMHVMYFNSVTGELLEPYIDEKIGKARFFPYVETDLNVIKIDKYAMLESNVRTSTNNDSNLPESLTVYVCVMANMEEMMDGVNEEGLPLLDGEVVTVDILRNMLYEHPSVATGGAAILSLPKTGMPMVGQQSLILKENDMSNNLTVELTAMMARVDFTVKIDAPSYAENLPELQLQNWSVHNLPSHVSLNNPSFAVTELADEDKMSAVIESQQIIYNKKGTISFSFYMLENIQEALTGVSGYPDSEGAPLQKYKPLLANNDAAYVIIDALYTTYDHVSDTTLTSTYDVKYKLYLGANHTDDFKVKRNFQYKNDITIVGLTNNDWTDIEGEISETTFDARVNISESNTYHISMLNERVLDAHFCVMPMDVYFFGNNKTDKKFVVSVDEDWVGMEKVTSEQMNNGEVGNSLQEVVGKGYMAGHGKRKFFTVDMVDELRTNATEITLDSSRDRIYFYIDENLVLEDRQAKITLKYYEGGELINTEQRIINQTHLLPVEVVHNGTTYRTIYMEAMEEYLDNYDPLDKFESNQVYDGLPWDNTWYEGWTEKKPDYAEIDNIAEADVVYNNYVDGLVYTIHVTKNFIFKYTLNDINADSDAFLYCYNKNKRCDDTGTISTEFNTNSLWNGRTYYDRSGTEEYERYPLYSGNHAKWFLPGISQMECAIKQYYTSFPEFQNKFYWSSSAGKYTEAEMILGIIERTKSMVDPNHARATKVDQSGNTVNSEYKHYTDGSKTDIKGEGYKSRGDRLRVRAFRYDLEPMTTHQTSE